MAAEISPAEERAPSLSHQVASGAVWATVGGFARQGVSLISNSILSHMLAPEIYGLIGMVNIFTNFIGLFEDLGLSYAIIRRDSVDRPFLSSMFWLSAVLGSSAAFMLYFGAWAAAAWFEEPELRRLLQVMSGTFIVNSLGTVPLALMIREFSFRKIAAIELAGGIATATAGVISAWNGYGVWSFVIAALVGQTLQSILFWSLSSFRPKIWFRLEDARSIFSFSANLSGFSIVNYFSRNADNFVIGSYLGKQDLGYYNQAYALMLYPLQLVVGALGRVMYPAFSQMKDDRPRFQAAYIRICSAIALVTFPMMLGLAMVARPLVHTYLGDRWDKTGVLLMILAPVGLLQSIGTTVGNIYTAMGRTEWLLRWGIFASLVNVAAFLIGKNWGSTGVAVAYAISTAAVLIVPSFAIPFRLIDLSLTRFARALAPVFAMSVGMAACVFGLLWFLPETLPAWAKLSAGVTTGIATYGAMVLTFKPAGYQDLLPMIEKLRRR